MVDNRWAYLSSPHLLNSSSEFFFSAGRASCIPGWMSLSVAVARASAPATPSCCCAEGDAMDAALWGELERFIDLSLIYAKLPLAPFFRLRLVCKEWNRLASDRHFLVRNFQPPISSNPYFIPTRPRGRHLLWTCEGSSWSSTPVPRARCEASGLIFEDSDRHRVFDVHTRVFRTLPPLPAAVQAPSLPVEEEDDYSDPLIALTVDATVIPYGFRVIIADDIIGTRIYDSNSGAWSIKPSTHEYVASAFNAACVHHNQSLYFRVGHACGYTFDVFIYDLERDEWDCQEIGSPRDMWSYSHIDIGVWRDRWFVFTTKDGTSLTLWEIATPFEQELCTLLDCMPRDICDWVMAGIGFLNILTKFCGGHVLLYNRMRVRKGEEERAVLYNLDQKTWDKIELPPQIGF